MFIVIEQHTLLQLTVYMHIMTVSTYLLLSCGAFKSFLLVWGWTQTYNACYSTQTAYKLGFNPVVQIIRQQGAKSLLS